MNKSPFNYIGNKFQVIQQLQDLFPENIDTLVDFFCGGCDVITNTPADKKIAIDVNSYVMDILKEFQHYSLDEILAFINMRIEEFGLSKTNEQGYLNYRDAYNNDDKYHTPLDLYVLSRFSFHFTMRFNKDLKMNAGFGRGFSNFSTRQQQSIKQFHKDIQNVTLLNQDFKTFDISNLTNNDLCYFDPPYLIANNVYNNGNSEVNQKWTEHDEHQLLKYIDNLNAHNIRFALSNVTHHRDTKNEILINWIEQNQFKVHEIKTSYYHCTHTVHKYENATIEVLVTNY